MSQDPLSGRRNGGRYDTRGESVGRKRSPGTNPVISQGKLLILDKESYHA